MKLEINIPDELLESFKTVTCTLNEALTELSNEFDSQSFKEATEEVYADIKESLKDIESDVEEGIKDGTNGLAEIFDMLFNYKSEDKPVEPTPEPQDEIIYHLTEDLITEVTKIDPTHVGWLRAYVEVPNEDYQERSQKLKTHFSVTDTLTVIFEWKDSPQGMFYWKNIYNSLKEVE